MKNLRHVWLGHAISIAALGALGALGVLAAMPSAASAPATTNPSANASAASPGAAPENGPGAAQTDAPQAEDAKTLYALGVLISSNLASFQLSPAEFELVKAGLNDGFNHRATQVDLKAATPQVQKLRGERLALLSKKQLQDGQAFLDEAARAPGARKTASGVVIIPLRKGAGRSPGPGDQVEVNYEGKLIDGTLFDSTMQRGQPAMFSLSGVIPCWSEALQLMTVGSKSHVICPPDQAYGVRGAPPKIPAQSTLDFEVELLAIAAAPPPAAARGKK